MRLRSDIWANFGDRSSPSFSKRQMIYIGPVEVVCGLGSDSSIIYSQRDSTKKEPRSASVNDRPGGLNRELRGPVPAGIPQTDTRAPFLSSAVYATDTSLEVRLSGNKIQITSFLSLPIRIPSPWQQCKGLPSSSQIVILRKSRSVKT